MTIVTGDAGTSSFPGLAELWSGRWAGVTRLTMAALASIVLYAVVAVATPWGTDAGTVAYYVPTVVGVALSLRPIRRSRGVERLGLAALLFALLASAVGDGIYSYNRLVSDTKPGFPGVADIFFYAGYSTFIVAVVALTFPRWRLQERRWLVEGGIVMAAAGTLSWYFVLAPTATASNQSTWAAIVALGYPLLDLGLLAVVVLTTYLSAGPLGPRARVLLVTAIAYLASDSAWTYLVATGHRPDGGEVWVGFAYGLVHWMMAACFLLPRDFARLAAPAPARGARLGPALAVAYGSVLLLAIAAFINALIGEVAPVLIGGAVVVLGLTLVGYLLLRRGNFALVQQFEHEYAYRHALVRAAEALGEASGVFADGRLVDVNEMACTMLGYRRNQLLTLSDPVTLLAPETRDQVLSSVRAAVAQGTPEARMRADAVKRDGQRIAIELAVAPIAIRGGRRLLVLARPAEAPAIPPSPLDVPEPVGEAEAPKALSPREREIVGLIARGYSNQDIADLLHISLKTVEVHTVNIRKKLPVHNRVQLVRYALQHGLVSLDEESRSGRRRREPRG